MARTGRCQYDGSIPDIDHPINDLLDTKFEGYVLQLHDDQDGHQKLEIKLQSTFFVG